LIQTQGLEGLSVEGAAEGICEAGRRSLNADLICGIKNGILAIPVFVPVKWHQTAKFRNTTP
jgi:hypothetical protein